jgi:hypothetical protein
MQKSKRFLLLASGPVSLIILTATGVYAWAYFSNPCEVNAVKQASVFLNTQLETYDSQYQFTTTVYRVGLNPPLRKLQEIFMDTQALSVPVCMKGAKNELLNYMRTVIRAFQAYGAGEDDANIRALVNESNAYYDNFKSEVEAVNKCAPFCFP